MRSATDSAIWRCRNAGARIAGRVRPRAAVRAARRSGAAAETDRGREAPVQPRRADARFCAPIRRLQAAQSAAARSGAAGAPAHQCAAAGAAHPRRQGASRGLRGRQLIRDWVRFVRRYDVRPHAIFLSDYDMLLTEQLVAGRGRLDQHAAAAVGSVRHQRHEGAGQRRAQSVRARRLVGRSLHARASAGLCGDGGGARRGSGVRRPRGRAAL